MTELINRINSNLRYINKKTTLYLISFYNKIYFLINKNFTLSKIYKPIIKEKMDINKNLQQILNTQHNKNKIVEKNILNLKSENESIQAKISIIQNIITKRHD
ncbi:hypothetical protein [Clostridium sp.]|uniref:hypothetical protein n=1 Tax=Clostridium sp. TaxID=1506 RepID=UPI001A3ED08E|nr:hypothetical protein [Clostridium sp.]MBK5242455.1 hypothetical protein [Clostridium sp.]